MIFKIIDFIFKGFYGLGYYEDRGKCIFFFWDIYVCVCGMNEWMSRLRIKLLFDDFEDDI